MCFISHENFRIPLALGVTRDSGDYAAKKCILCNSQRMEFKYAIAVNFYNVRNFELDIEFWFYLIDLNGDEENFRDYKPT